MTFRLRIILIVGFTCTFSLLTTLSVASIFLHSSNETHFKHRAEIITKIISTNFIVPILKKDIEKIDELSRDLIASSKIILRVCVFDNYGIKLSTCRCRSSTDHIMPGEYIHEQDIIVDDQQIGSIGIAFDITEIEQDILFLEKELFILAFFLLLFSIFVAWFFGDSISKQFSMLITQFDKDDLKPVPVFTNKCELDKITNIFNKLVEKHNKEENIE